MPVKKTRLKLADLIDPEELQVIQDNLAVVTGLSTVIFDPGWKRVTRQSLPYVQFCAEIIKSTAKGRKACNRCDKDAGKRALARLEQGQPPEIYSCHANLWDFVAPVVVQDRLLGYLFCGRVRAEEDGEINSEEHAQKAHEYGINPEVYLRALRDVPVLPKSKIEASANVLYQVARAISSQAYEKIGQKRRADKMLSDLNRQAQELTNLQKVASALVQAEGIESAFRNVLDEAHSLIGADSLCFYKYDAENDRFETPIAIGVRDEAKMTGPTTESSVVRRVLTLGKPVFAENSSKNEILAGPFVTREQVASSVAFPLQVAGRRVGVLFINFCSRQRFTKTRKQALETLANQFGIAVDNWRLVEELNTHIKKLSHIHASAEAVHERVNLEEVFKQIVKGVRDAFGFDGAALYLVNEKENIIYGAYAEGAAEAWLSESRRALDGHDILPYIWSTGETVVISGDDSRFDRTTFERHLHHDWVRVFMPIRCIDKIAGVLEAGYFLNHKKMIGDEEVKVLQSFVYQVEAAVRNARLLSETEALLELAHVLSSEFDMFEILETIVQAIDKVIPYSTCTVVLLDKKKGVLTPNISHGVDAKHVLDFELKPGEGITGQVFSSGKSRIENKALSGWKERGAMYVPGTELKEECLLIVPVRSGNEVLGTINLNRYGVAPFTEHDCEWVEAAANHAGVAIQRAELFNRYQKLVGSAKTINEILELKKVLEIIAEHAAKTLNAPIVNVMLVEDNGNLPIVADFGLPSGFQLPTSLRVGEGLSGWIAAQRKPYQALDIINDPHTVNRGYLNQHGHKSYLGVPMLYHAQLVGVLNVHTEHPRQFTEEEVAVIRTFSDLAAVAVVNSRLFEQAVREFEMLSRVGKDVSSAVGLNETLTRLLREGCELVKANRGCVRTFDSARQFLVPQSWWPQEEKEPPVLEKSQGTAGWVWKTDNPYMANDVDNDPYYYPFYGDVKSELAVPIRTRDEVIGVLNVSSKNKNVFDDRHRRLLTALADLASVAIERGNLLVALREVAQATMWKPEELFQLLITKARGLIRVMSAPSIWLLDQPNKNIYYAAGDKDGPFENCAPLSMKGTISGKVITEGKPMVVEDIYSEPLYHYIDIARKANLKSLLSAPILAGDKAVGVFNAHTTTPHRFQDWEVNLLSAFAAQAGAAIEINKTLRRLILLHNYAETLTQADDFAEIVDRVVKRTRDAYNADITGLWLYDSATDSFYHGASCGLSPEEVEKALPRLKGMSNQIISTKEPIIIPDIRMSTPGTVNPHAIEVGGKAIAGLPLLVGTRPVGVLYVDFLQPHYYTSEEVETLQAMANLAAVAVDNARGMEARRQFLVNVTHDLKAPLAAMDAQLQMLNLFGFDPGRFKNTYGETRRLIQLVDSLLGLLRAEYAAKPVRFEEVKLVEILSNIEVVWSALIKMRGLTMHVEVAPGAEVVYSDEERVRCIIFNLIDNAVKFAKKGGYVCVQATGNECSFTITVENDGHGMVPELVEQLRLKRNQTPEPPWVEMETGVGYAAIRRFVADLGGEVDIQSSDKGTKVIVTLPMLQRETMSQERRID